VSDAQDVAPIQKKAAADEKTIRELVAQLGDDSFEKREAADKRLADIGEPAVPWLKKAVKENTDAEVRERAQALIDGIQNRLFPFLWSVEGQKNQAITCVALCPNGKQFVSASFSTILLWDVESGKQLAKLGGGARSMAISADGKKLIAGSNNKNAYVIDIATGKDLQKLTGHTGAIFGVALLPDGKRALTGAKDKSLRLWDIEKGEQLAEFPGVVEGVYSLALSPDGRSVAVGHYGAGPKPSGIVRLWDVETQKEIREFPGHTREVTGVSFSADGKQLLSSSFDRTVRLWDLASGKELNQFNCESLMEHAYFVVDGKRILCCGKETELNLQLWDVEQGKRILRSPTVPGGFRDIAALPGSNRAVGAGVDGVLRLWQWQK
jgi:Tol biopolymer transport system component